MNTKKLTFGALLIAIGTILGTIIYIPLGVSKLYPMQHFINIVSAVTLGPFYAVLVAFVISLLRNILGIGTILAFPGSMIGALLAGILFKKTKNILLGGIGELFGTGIIGGIIAYPVAMLFLGKKLSLFYFVVPFLSSSLAGTIIAVGLLSIPMIKAVVYNNIIKQN